MRILTYVIPLIIIGFLGSYSYWESRSNSKDREIITEYLGLKEKSKPQDLWEFYEKHSHHHLAIPSAFEALEIYLKDKNYSEALRITQILIQKTQSLIPIQIQLGRVLASLYVQDKNYPEALKWISFLEEIKDNPVLSEIKLFKAQILYLTGDKTQASQILKSLEQESSTSQKFMDYTPPEASLWLGFWNL
jgi:predicted negative regulator of RcsB-dependent stress response